MQDETHQARASNSKRQVLFEGVRREVLSWIGIAGSIVTLISGIQDFFKLAHWAALLADNFTSLTLWFWSHVFFFLPTLTPLMGWLLNLVTFFVTVALASMRKRQPEDPPKAAKNARRDVLVGLGLAMTFGLAIIALAGLYKSGALAPADYQMIASLKSWLSPYVPPPLLIGVGSLLILAPLIVVMNGLGWLSHFFGFVADQGLAVVRIWQINVGVILVLALSTISKYLAPMCANDGPLAWLCGG